MAIQAIGAAAGLAAVAGLAVLSALYVSHARDVKRLREWAGGAPERSAASRGRTAVIPQPRWYSRLAARPVALVLVGLFVLGGAAASGVTELAGGGDSSGHGSPKKPKRHGSAVKPGNVTVAVLNGTMVPGLAATLRDRIGAAGFKKGAINDFSDKRLAESVVEYAPGQQAAAKAVGRSVGISQVAPVTATARALAGVATVIVIAGADKAP
jgi:hypothetical protein